MCLKASVTPIPYGCSEGICLANPLDRTIPARMREHTRQTVSIILETDIISTEPTDHIILIFSLSEFRIYTINFYKSISIIL